jgi:hypothetical protein
MICIAELFSPRRGTIFRLSFFIVLNMLLFAFTLDAAISDRVIAFVDDEAITRSELEEQHSIMKGLSSEITEKEVLNTMINRIIIMREARKYRIEASSPDEMMHEFIDLKVRAFIRVPDAEIERYYNESGGTSSGREYDEIRDEIEQYLTEKKLNIRLKETLDELKKSAYIKIQLEEGS